MGFFISQVNKYMLFLKIWIITIRICRNNYFCRSYTTRLPIRSRRGVNRRSPKCIHTCTMNYRTRLLRIVIRRYSKQDPRRFQGVRCRHLNIHQCVEFILAIVITNVGSKINIEVSVHDPTTTVQWPLKDLFSCWNISGLGNAHMHTSTDF